MRLGIFHNSDDEDEAPVLHRHRRLRDVQLLLGVQLVQPKMDDESRKMTKQRSEARQALEAKYREQKGDSSSDDDSQASRFKDARYEPLPDTPHFESFSLPGSNVNEGRTFSDVFRRPQSEDEEEGDPTNIPAFPRQALQATATLHPLRTKDDACQALALSWRQCCGSLNLGDKLTRQATLRDANAHHRDRPETW